jgi:hypothetical protein
MKVNATSMKIISLSLLPLSLGLAFVLDRWAAVVMKTAQATFDYRSALLASLTANFLTMAAILVLGWTTIFSIGRSKLVGFIYLLVGLLMMIIPFSTVLWETNSALLSVLFISPIREFRLALMAYGLDSRFSLVSSFIVLIGLVDLMLPRKST